MLAVNYLFLVYALTVHGRAMNRNMDRSHNRPPEWNGSPALGDFRQPPNEARGFEQTNRRNEQHGHQEKKFHNRPPTMKGEPEFNHHPPDITNRHRDEGSDRNRNNNHNQEMGIIKPDVMPSTNTNERIPTLTSISNTATTADYRIHFEDDQHNHTFFTTKPADLREIRPVTRSSLLDAQEFSNKSIPIHADESTTKFGANNIGSKTMQTSINSLMDNEVQSTTVSLRNLEFDDRAAFNGGQCASGYVKVKGMCVVTE